MKELMPRQQRQPSEEGFIQLSGDNLNVKSPLMILNSKFILLFWKNYSDLTVGVHKQVYGVAKDDDELVE
jgi:hypothetical protein